MKFLTPVQRQSKNLLLGETLLLVGLIGAIDWFSGYEVSLALFYGAPIMAAIWYCDKKAGVLVAIVCAIAWWWADILAGHYYPKRWLAIWEPCLQFGYFGFVAWAGAALKEKHDAIRARIDLLEHAHRLEREIIEISEREQRRIGRDLHDGLCQHFAAIGCGVASLRADLLQQHMPNEAAIAAELAELLNNGVVQARDLARGLVPVQMDEAGLSFALEELAGSVSRLQNIECAFDSDGEVEIGDASAATHLYRIAQEAINNACRHGAASNIRLGLLSGGDSATLSIADNGCGISRTGNGSRGLGLNIMSYRARLVGGNLAIAQAPGGGTLISCTFPRQTWNRQQHDQAA
jgi:signal transduction histidine kinase